MQLYIGDHPGKASVMFLPVIDMNPSDSTCIYSTLVCSSVSMHKDIVYAPILTFDQPLWWKALMIIESRPEESDLRRIVLYLDGFQCLVKISAVTCSSYTRFLGVTQHHVCMGLEREHPLASLEQAIYSVSKQRCSILIQPPCVML